MKKKIHVQHVVLSLQPGGLENGVVNVVNRLSPDRFQSSICCLKRAGEFAARVSPGISIHEMGWRGGNDPWLPFRLARLFRKARPDVIHTRNAESFFYGFLGAKIAGVKGIIHSEHGRAFDDRAIRLRVQGWFFAHTKAVFAVSKQLKRDLALHTRIPEQRIQVLHNGVDLVRFQPRDRAAVRREIGVTEDDLVIGSVGRLVEVKNYPLLLRAVAALPRKDVVTVLVGAGPEKGSLEALAKRLGIEHRVRFLGHRDDVTLFLSAMDVFVLPSISEGMSNTLLEAMAGGVACVVSEVGGNPEIVTHGRSGFLFANGNEMALTGYLQLLCSDPELRRTIGQSGRARIVRDFSIESMIERYEALYLATLADIGRKK